MIYGNCIKTKEVKLTFYVIVVTKYCQHDVGRLPKLSFQFQQKTMKKVNKYIFSQNITSCRLLIPFVLLNEDRIPNFSKMASKI